jgi:hypothetical protein
MQIALRGRLPDMKARRPRKVQVCLRLGQVDVDRLLAVARAYEARTPGLSLPPSAAARAALHVGLPAAPRALDEPAGNETAPMVLVGVSLDPADLARLDALVRRRKGRSRSAVARAAVRAGLDRIEHDLGLRPPPSPGRCDPST